MAEATPDEIRVLWRRISDELRASLPAATFGLWLEPLKPASALGETLYLSAPESVRAWVERRYLGPILTALTNQDSPLRRVAIIAEGEHVSGRGATESSPPELDSLPVAPTHTFERFVIGPGNRLAHAAALAAAELPGEAYNPLFLHGPPGLGKTHLMGAITGYIRENHPELTVHYTTAERFTSEFVTALRSDGPERFKRRYRGLDALLIDDIQILEGKAKTEEEFVHTFNALHSAGKQIILSSDRPPGALSRLEERLRDRFEWGLTVEIEPPDLRTRMTVLWRLAADAGTQLPEADALREIAGRVPGNLRLLEGALTRAIAVASVFGEPLDPDLVRKALSRTEQALPAAGEVVVAPSVAAIQEAVCAVLGVDLADLRSAKRTPLATRARHLAMYLTRELTPLSLAQIAREFNRDHSTVLHAIRAVEGKLEPGSPALGDLHRARGLLRIPLDKPEPGGRSVHDPDNDPQA